MAAVCDTSYTSVRHRDLAQLLADGRPVAVAVLRCFAARLVEAAVQCGLQPLLVHPHGTAAIHRHADAPEPITVKLPVRQIAQ